MLSRTYNMAASGCVWMGCVWSPWGILDRTCDSHDQQFDWSGKLIRGAILGKTYHICMYVCARVCVYFFFLTRSFFDGRGRNRLLIMTLHFIVSLNVEKKCQLCYSLFSKVSRFGRVLTETSLFLRENVFLFILETRNFRCFAWNFTKHWWDNYSLRDSPKFTFTWRGC